LCKDLRTIKVYLYSYTKTFLKITQDTSYNDIFCVTPKIRHLWPVVPVNKTVLAGLPFEISRSYQKINNMITPEKISVEEQYKSLSEGFRAVYIAENLLREFVSAVLTDMGLDIQRECQAVLRSGGKRSIPPGALTEQGPLEMCTLGELIQILYKPVQGTSSGSRFEAKFKNLNVRDFRSMLDLARGTRNTVAHFVTLSRDAIANVRELSRWLIEFLTDMHVTSPRVEELIQMFREQNRKEEEVYRRRSLTCAAYGVPHPSVVDDVAEHLAHPDPETSAIMGLPGALASALDLRSTFRFTQNATQAFRDILEVILFHELDHDSRPGEEGADVAQLLMSDQLKNSPEIGRLIHSDIDHPAFQHMARAVWPESNIAVVNLSDLIFEAGAEKGSRQITEQAVHRYLSEIKRKTVSAVVIPHVYWVNGAKFDVRSISKAIRAQHPLVTIIVDGAQAVGHVQLDVEKCERENEEIDFYIGCGHKWLRGPETVGFVRVGRRYNSESECPRCLNYLATSDQLTDASGLALNYQGEQVGTNQRGLAKGLLRALKLLPDKKEDREVLYARVRRNADTLREIIKRFPGLVLLDSPAEIRTGIVAFTLRPQGSDLLLALQEALRVELFTSIAYPLPPYLEERWGSGNFLRFSPGAELTEHDFQRLEEIFRRTLL
jgi:selenocysteine lyase/cysteine desulfurase